MARRKHIEDSEHEIIAEFIDGLGLAWFHPPNGGWRTRTESARLKRMGVKSGVSDFIIITPPNNIGNERVPDGWFTGHGQAFGCAIEYKPDIKTRKPTESQLKWISTFRKNNWVSGWIRGVEPMKQLLRDLYR